jgi:signal transduction histidine kinase
MAIVQNIIEQHDGRIFASNVKLSPAVAAILNFISVQMPSSQKLQI